MSRRHTDLTAPPAAAEWISMSQAQVVAECSEPTVATAVAAGEIQQRRGLPRGVPSLQHASVREWAQRRLAAQRAATSIKDLVDQASTGPPDDVHRWISTKTAALIVGVSPGWLVTLAAQDRAPHTRVGARLWWRLDQVEVMAAARATRLRQQ